MTANISPCAGKPIDPKRLVNVPQLVTAYYTGRPDPAIPAERVSFGTSGHRGSSFDHAFNETHILAIAQAICQHRKMKGVDGPLYIGIDTHALSEPALATALEVLIGNDIDVMIDTSGHYTPTPVVSHAILTHNRGRTSGLADGIVITPSHNPPRDGGFKYNPPNGGPAGSDVTGWIEKAANSLIKAGLIGVRRVPYDRALKSVHFHRHDYISAYVADLANVVDLQAIRSSGVHIGIDPLGGASQPYWAPIIERYGLNATVVNDAVDPTFRFMTADWDGQIRMDCSSPYAMTRLIGLRDTFDIAFANDTDADRHGIVTKSSGVMNPNHFLAIAISYLFMHRPRWRADCGVGKTIVSSGIIDRVAKRLGRKLIEVPVGFKWFSEGLFDGALGFGGEESAGAAFLRLDGSVWTTDKDGLILGLLAAEMTATGKRDPGRAYDELAEELGTPYYARVDTKASAKQKEQLAALTPTAFGLTKLAGEPVLATLTTAPGNGAVIGGIKVVTASGWFAARPSGTEDIYKLYAESFRDEAHLQEIQSEAQDAIAKLFASTVPG